VPTPTQHRSDDATAHHSFDDVEHWKRVFDDPRRDTWQKPAEVVGALDLKTGMAVADLGAGTGYFLRYLSAAVGETGTVFAVEVEPNLLVHIRKRCEEESTRNVVPTLASPDNPRLPPRRVDLVLIADTYHHINDRLVYLRRLADVLTQGGRVAIVDWFKRELPEGPPPSHKLSRQHVLDEMRAADYELIEEPTFLPYQYFLIFAPKRTAVR
jgi:ubiquinone/menaquinone biosynthesis C-methylase UbiE